MTRGTQGDRAGPREGIARQMTKSDYRARATDSRPLLTVRQVADYLGFGRDTVYRLIRNGDLRAVTVASELRVRPADLDAYLEARAS